MTRIATGTWSIVAILALLALALNAQPCTAQNAADSKPDVSKLPSLPFTPNALVNSPDAAFPIRDVAMNSAAMNATSSDACLEWSPVSISANGGHGIVFDSDRNVYVVFGGIGPDFGMGTLGDTWEYEVAKQRWIHKSSTGPMSRAYHAMAYDSVRKVVVLHGGLHTGIPGSILGDTWEWDGYSWSLRSNEGPGERHFHSMAFDSKRGVSVLFGYGSDIWEWDGTTWALLATQGPLPRYRQSLSYDQQRGVTILFGGTAGFGINFSDTWEWDGIAWQQIAANGPSARFGHGMSYDEKRNVTVLFGGGAGGDSHPASDTWEFDGTSWTQRPEVTPNGRYQVAMIYDSIRQVSVFFGGYYFRPFGDEWTWDGKEWTQVSETPWRGNAMVYDSTKNSIAIIDALSDIPSVWMWNGADWSKTLTPSLPPRSEFRVVYDSKRDVIVLFGGLINLAPTNETWELHGEQWLLRSNSGPLPRDDHDMVYDYHRGVTVLFGGRTSGGAALGDTWEWDGGTGVWTQRFSEQSPPARYDHCMGYDSVRQRVVLSGGNIIYPGTWEWDGVNWELRSSIGGTGYMERAVFDSARHAVVRANSFGHVQQWNGSAWSTIPVAGTPTGYGMDLAYDSARSTLHMFRHSASQLWHIQPTPLPADVNDDGIVNANDLLAIINAWGACPPQPQSCPADVSPAPNGDGMVNVNDLLTVIDNWGCGQ